MILACVGEGRGEGKQGGRKVRAELRSLSAEAGKFFRESLLKTRRWLEEEQLKIYLFLEAFLETFSKLLKKRKLRPKERNCLDLSHTVN